MNLLRLCSMLVCGMILALHGCGGKAEQKPSIPAAQHEKKISELQSVLAKAQDQLAQEKKRSEQLAVEAESLRGELKDLEEKVARTPSSEQEPAEGQDSGEDRGITAENRVSLLGAKALAEYKADRFKRRVDKLTEDLNLKEQQLNEIKEKAQQKDAEVARLSEELGQIRAQDKERTTQINAKLQELEKEVSLRSSEMERLKAEVQDKAGLLEALKNSTSDCTKLKSGAEAEAKRLQAQVADLTAKLETMQKQAVGAHQEIERWQADEAESRRAAEQFREEAEQFRTEAEQLKAEADRAREEAQDLSAIVSDLKTRLNAATAKAAANEPSTVDMILRVPTASKEPAEERPLY